MEITCYGTAGSLPVCRPNRTRHGGNTTCLRIQSECLPAGMVLAVDAGTGYYPLCMDVLKEGDKRHMLTLFTHYHHDHTQGLLLVPQTYMKSVKMELIGPVDKGAGPKEVFETLMEPPFHPVSSAEVKSHFHFAKIEHPAGTVMLFHPQGGKKQMQLHEFETLENRRQFVPIGEGKYPVQECLVVRMLKATHPEQTISYRFEERPTGRVFVFLTDHENTDGIARALRTHIEGAHVFIADAQYDRRTYETRTAGFGHGTGDYVVRLAEHCGVKRVGLTHHDPGADDDTIEGILAEALAARSDMGLEVFSCQDMQTVLV